MQAKQAKLSKPEIERVKQHIQLQGANGFFHTINGKTYRLICDPASGIMGGTYMSQPRIIVSRERQHAYEEVIIEEVITFAVSDISIEVLRNFVDQYDRWRAAEDAAEAELDALAKAGDQQVIIDLLRGQEIGRERYATYPDPESEIAVDSFLQP